MSAPYESNVYTIAMLDILGFESLFNKYGLNWIAEKYQHIIEVIDRINARTKSLQNDLKMTEGAIAVKNENQYSAGVFARYNGTYASDTIVIWTHNRFPKARNISPEEIAQRQKDPEFGWNYHPIPLDHFLGICCEVISKGIELGLPLRGAIATGEAIMDQERGVFLGKPMIDAARMEKNQKIIGIAMCESALQQKIPNRFKLLQSSHLKDPQKSSYGGYVIDWPRHWRKTRNNDIGSIITAMNTNPVFSEYYVNTLETIQKSYDAKGRHEKFSDTDISLCYPQFNMNKCRLPIRLVREPRGPTGLTR